MRSGRIRAAGAGCERLRDTDPESPLRWTTKSTRKLAEELSGAGHRVGADSVAALLKAEGFSLQATSRTTEGARHPAGTRSSAYINERVAEHLDAGQPVVSVDAEKKEVLGEYAVAGREWHRSERRLVRRLTGLIQSRGDHVASLVTGDR